jgi:diguanylate cyclase (GGDEF)-like protein
MRTAGQRQGRVALLLTDLNRFKDINDTLGHHHGDLLLAQVAERLVRVLRDTDTVARLGGDEFAVLLPLVADAADALSVAAKLHTALEQPFYLDELSVEVDTGIGLAMYPDHATDPDELLRMADIAMYAAKTAHLEYQVFEPRLDKHSPRKLALLGQVRTGIAEGQMVLHYQPKVDARTGRPTGTEALVRWQHPDYGLLGPGEFIPLAEATGLIHPLTFHVLELALRQQRIWLDAGHTLRVAVNLSPHCLRDPAAPAHVERLLQDTGVPARLLVLEITESAVMADSGRALETLNQLHEMGVRLSIDDFGMEYSSLGRLKDLPVHELKIDRSFVSAVRVSRKELAIARSIIELGHSLGLEVVAEGVEDQETWTELELLGCDILQGFYIAKPLPADEMPGWLATWPQQRGLAAVGTGDNQHARSAAP